MARAVDQFRVSDVTLWAYIALACGALAVLSANISAIVPSHVYASLHASRLDGASLNQLRKQVATLEAETARMRRENNQLLSRFAMAEQLDGEVARRVGALEISLPKLLEALPADAAIDLSAVTASVATGDTVTFDAEGGSVSVTQQPLSDPGAAVPSEHQEMPELPSSAGRVAVPDASVFGVAIGKPVAPDDGKAGWEALTSKAGTLLVGLAPILADGPEGAEKRIVAGPIPDMSQALALCTQIVLAGVECQPVPFTGAPLAE